MAAGSIIWELLLRTASFTTDVKRTEAQMKKFKKEAEAMGRAFGVAIAAGAAAATYALKQSIDAMDEASKAAQSLGTTTEVITQLSYAASLADVEFSQLSKSLVKLTSDTPEALEAFKQMGISTKDVGGNLKDLPTLLGDVADKFSGYRDGAEKTALAVAIFGEKIGPKLIPLLNAGARGFAELADEARALGVVIDTETGKSAEQFNDNLTRIGASLRGVANEITKTLLPALISTTDNFILGKKAGLGFWQAFTGIGVRDLSEGIGDATESAGRHIQELNKELDGLLKRQDGLKSATVTSDNRSAIAGDLARIEEDINLVKAKRKYFQGLQASTAATASYSNEVRSFGLSVAPIVDPKAAAAREKERLAALKKYKDDLAKARKEIEEEGRRLAESVQTPSERLTSAQGNVNRLAGAGVIDPETQRRALAEAQTVYDQYVQTQRQMLTDGLLTEEQEIQASYERRRQMIQSLTEATDAEKSNSVAALTEQRDAEINRLQYQRYADLLSEEERATKEYMARKRSIEDDEALSAEQRYAYLTTLGEQYHKKMNALDEEDQAKREELNRKQIQLVSDGFGGVADLTKAFAGEQSKEYQAMFAASKAFALADITVKQSQAIAKAWGENNYWTAIGLSAALIGQFAGLISSTNSASFGGTRADGGSVNAGRSYLVGERGPEMFTPNEGGRIIPNHAMGATSVNVSVDASGSKVQGDEQNANALGRKIGSAVRSILMDEKRPGGLLAT